MVVVLASMASIPRLAFPERMAFGKAVDTVVILPHYTVPFICRHIKKFAAESKGVIRFAQLAFVDFRDASVGVCSKRVKYRTD